MTALALLLCAAAQAGAAQAGTAQAGPSTAPAPGAALQAALRAVRQDGAVALSAAARADLLALLPAGPREDACPEAPQAAAGAFALRDRGDGALLVAQVTTCRGGRVFAVSTGEPPRIARLLDAQAQEVRSVRALNLGGGTRERDLGVELAASQVSSELRLFQRSETGFSFNAAGALKDFNALRECAAAGDEESGWSSWLRSEEDRLAVLRLDGTCAGGVWQASCVVYEVAQGNLTRTGRCRLPAKLEARALRGSGWR